MKNPRHLSKPLLGAFFLSVLCVASIGAQPVESPVGTFNFSTPEVPPEPPYPITEMAYLAGSYVDNSGGAYLNVTVDLAMDESGKVLAIGVIPGFTDKKDLKTGSTEDSDNVRTLYVRTINGEPVLTANSTVKGSFDGNTGMELLTGDPVEAAPTTGSGQADIHLGAFPPFTDPDFAVVPVKSSFNGKLGTEKEKAKPSMSFLFLDPTQVQALAAKDWYMTLTISQELDPRDRPFYVATLRLIKPNNTEIRFPGQRVSYSDKSGYTINFDNGAMYHDSEPVLNAKNRPVIDKTTKVKFSNLLFKKNFDYYNNPMFVPAAGGVNYQFLGQKGFGQIFNFYISNGWAS